MPGPRPVWHRDPTIKPNLGKQRQSLLPKTSLKQVILYENNTEDRILDSRMATLQLQQDWTRHVHNHQKKSFVVRQLVQQQCLRQQGVDHLSLLPSMVANAYRQMAMVRCMYFSYTGAKDLPLYRRLNHVGFNNKVAGNLFNGRDNHAHDEQSIIIQGPTISSKDQTEPAFQQMERSRTHYQDGPNRRVNLPHLTRRPVPLTSFSTPKDNMAENNKRLYEGKKSQTVLDLRFRRLENSLAPNTGNADGYKMLSPSSWDVKTLDK